MCNTAHVECLYDKEYKGDAVITIHFTEGGILTNP